MPVAATILKITPMAEAAAVGVRPLLTLSAERVVCVDRAS
jgi:hypothetical protein